MNLFCLKVLRKLGVAGAFNIIGTRVVQGKLVRFPVHGALGWQFVQDAEGWMTSLLQSLKPYFDQHADKAFLDVGVNVGQTLVKYRSLMPNGIYVGFEPNPACVAYVADLVDLNKWDHIRLYPVGVSESAEICELIFFHNSAVDSTASIIDGFRPDDPVARRSNIALFPLSGIDLGRSVSFMKIDVEGAELEVLRGSEALLRRERPLVSSEILPCYDSSNTFRLKRQEEVESLMRKIGYKCARIMKSGPHHGEFSGLQVIDEIGIHNDLDLADYLWIPDEKLASILDISGQQAA